MTDSFDQEVPLIAQRVLGEQVCQLLLDGHDPRSKTVGAATNAYATFCRDTQRASGETPDYPGTVVLPSPCPHPDRADSVEDCALCAQERARVAALIPVLDTMYLLASADTDLEDLTDRSVLATAVVEWASTRGVTVETPLVLGSLEPDAWRSQLALHLKAAYIAIRDVIAEYDARIRAVEAGTTPGTEAIAGWKAAIDEAIEDRDRIPYGSSSAIFRVRTRYEALLKTLRGEEP